MQPMRAWTKPCPSCGVDNFTLQLRCSDCGAYVRDRVPALDLFSTLWGMLEQPTATALRIGRSEQKNYTHLLFALCGPLFFAAMLFVARVGDTTMPFGYLLLGVVAVGPVLGLLLLAAASLLQRLLFRLFFGVILRYRETAAWVAWSLTPMMWASVIVFPIQLSVFGLILFSTNPAPWQLLPLPFWMLGILSMISVIWSLLLLPLGFRVHGPSYKSILIQQVPLWLFLAIMVLVGAELLRAFA
ncbi:MAG: hypothetical protein IH600_14020 [Bacteroidetes bacterium]|nr:hypothetical protein [Bacteroidota bacterium]